jgi:ribosomal protein S6--L-glutamate ligase
MIISFFPGFKGDYNFFQFEPLDEKIFSLLSQARAVIFPPTISPLK